MDVVVTLPKKFGLQHWINEGDPAGEKWSGNHWAWNIGSRCPKKLERGESVYVVYDGHLIGYSPLVWIERTGQGFALVRGGGAKAVTIDQKIKGFQGFRYRWWDRSEERPFPEWRKLA